jgi:mannosyltransferase
MSVMMARPAPPGAVAADRSIAALASAIGAITTLLSAAGSWVPSLWGDEVTSVMSAQRPLASLLMMLGHVDAVHGTYYLGLHLWGALFGFSPFSVRFPSALAVGAAAAGVVVLVARLRSRRAAVIAGLMCAILPRVTYMGEEARSYAFSAAIVTWLTVVLVIALQSERVRTRWWVVYGAVLAVGIYTFLYTVLFVVVHLLIVVAARAPRRTLTGWITASTAGVVCTAPLMVFAVLERAQISYLGSTPQFAPDTLISSLWFGQMPFSLLAWALILVAVVAQVRRARQNRATAALPFRVSLEFVAVAWLLIPAGLLIGMFAFVPDFTARYVSFSAPAAAILLACGIDALLGFRGWVGLIAMLLVLLLAVPIDVAERTPYAKNQSDWAQISAAVGEHARPGDAVVFDESARLSKRPRLAMHAYPAGFEGLRDVTLQTPFTRATTWHDLAYTVHAAARLGRFDGVTRVWLIEYASSAAHPDSYGVADLQQLGFQATSTSIATHRGVITLYMRTP